MAQIGLEERSRSVSKRATNQILPWLGILGAAITLFSNLQGAVTLADWARFVVTNWTEWMRLAWGTLFGWFGISIPQTMYGPLTFLVFTVATATRLRVREAISSGQSWWQMQRGVSGQFDIDGITDPKLIVAPRFDARSMECQRADEIYKRLPPVQKQMRISLQFLLFLAVCLAFSWNLFDPQGIGVTQAALLAMGSAIAAIILTMFIRNAFLPGTVFWWSASITDALAKTIGVALLLLALNEISKLGLDQYLVAPKVPA
jgi:hypothetical protein